ncbi:MAG: hypothetical protein ACKPEN_13750 [Planktothrix sp.]
MELVEEVNKKVGYMDNKSAIKSKRSTK